MFKLNGFRLSRHATTFGVLAFSAVAFSSAASAAAQPPLFPFFLPPPPMQSAMPPSVQAVPDENQSSAIEMPARLKRRW
jgi:hypothetical protein